MNERDLDIGFEFGDDAKPPKCEENENKKADNEQCVSIPIVSEIINDYNEANKEEEKCNVVLPS